MGATVVDGFGARHAVRDLTVSDAKRTVTVAMRVAGTVAAKTVVREVGIYGSATMGAVSDDDEPASER